jgi:hypothetical protein
MAYETNMNNHEFPRDGGSETGRVESNCGEPATECAGPPLEMLPSNPYRSLGGFLNYAGWPDCDRLMELDRAIQRKAQESADDHLDSDEPEAPPPVLRCSKRLPNGIRCRNRFQPTAEYAGWHCEDHRTTPSVEHVLKGIEDLALRRL